VKVTTELAQAVELLKARPEVSSVEVVEERLKVTLIDHESDPTVIPDVLVRGGVRVAEMREDEIGLEEVFLRVTRGETQ
jgi:ABC-2 type transport system ATP-binding protein